MGVSSGAGSTPTDPATRTGVVVGSLHNPFDDHQALLTERDRLINFFLEGAGA